MPDKPKIIAILGHAGAGKDTVAQMILDSVDGQRLAFADPMKVFCQRVFDFSDQQLWGPSEFRNAIDPRYSLAPPIQQHGFIRRFRDFVIGPFYKEPTVNDAHWNRILAKVRFCENAYEFLNDILPPDVDYAHAKAALYEWMDELMASTDISPRVALQTLGTDVGRDRIHKDIWVDKGLRKASELATSGRYAIISDTRFNSEARKVRQAGGQVWRIRRDVDLSSSVFQHASEKDQFSTEMSFFVTHDIVNDKGLEDLEATVKRLLML